MPGTFLQWVRRDGGEREGGDSRIVGVRNGVRECFNLASVPPFTAVNKGNMMSSFGHRGHGETPASQPHVRSFLMNERRITETRSGLKKKKANGDVLIILKSATHMLLY